MKKKWIPFTNADFAAGTPFNVRHPGGDPIPAVFNAYGQALHAETRRLIEPAPAEMEADDEPAAPAKPAPPADKPAP